MNASEISLVQLALALCVGISLSAACGFRVFVPLLAPVVAGIGALLVVGLAGWVLLKLWRKVRRRRVVNV